jgi:hypothetical protein
MEKCKEKKCVLMFSSLLPSSYVLKYCFETWYLNSESTASQQAARRVGGIDGSGCECCWIAWLRRETTITCESMVLEQVYFNVYVSGSGHDRSV